MKHLSTLLQYTYNIPLILQKYDTHALISIQFNFLLCLEMNIEIGISYLHTQNAIIDSTPMARVGSGLSGLVE